MATTERTQTDALQFLRNEVRVLVDGAASGGALALLELSGPRGDMPPLHVHQREDEVFYVLEGQMTVFVGDRTLELAAGDSAFAPRGIPHVYRVESDTARWLALALPAGFDGFVREVAAHGPGVDPALVGEIAGRYEIEILGPPGALPGQ